MYLSVMNALIKLLLSQGNKIYCFKGEGKIPSIGSYRCASTCIRFFRGQFLPGLLGLTFVRHKVLAIF